MLCKFRHLQLIVKIPNKLLLKSVTINIFPKKVLQTVSADLLLFLELFCIFRALEHRERRR